MAGSLPEGFLFTQTALRTYQECPYRFRLRYLERIPWPAFPAAPEVEAALERGRRFHDLARQRFLGLEVGDQAAACGEEVARWWAALEASPPALEGYPHRFPEAGLSIPFGRYRLAARYDLLAVGEGCACIVDWKTGRPLPAEKVLAQDLQTRVYLFVLAEGGAAYHQGRPLPPERLSLLYWHPAGPTSVRLSYGPERQEEDRACLADLVARISACPAEEMLPVPDEAACRGCAYAPLCGRPGARSEDWEEDFSPEEEGEEAFPD